MRKNLLALLFLASCTLLAAQQTLNNDSVINLVKAGLSDDLIISTINASPGTYDVSAGGLTALRSAGAGDKVVSAVMARAAGVQTDQSSMPPQALDGRSGIAPIPAAQPFPSPDGKIRVFVTDRPVSEPSAADSAPHKKTEDEKRIVEVQADMLKVCPAYVIASNIPDRADYVLVFRRHGASRTSAFMFGGLAGLALSAAAKVDGASLFNANGDMVYATKQNSVEKAVKDICDHIPASGVAPGPVPARAPVPAPSPAALPVPDQSTPL